jgi:hypothetical protein
MRTTNCYCCGNAFSNLCQSELLELNNNPEVIHDNIVFLCSECDKKINSNTTEIPVDGAMYSLRHWKEALNDLRAEMKKE